MKILDVRPVPLAEVNELVKDMEEKKDIHAYLKKFSKTSQEKSEKIIDGVRKLENPKVKEADIIKISDILPDSPEDLNKIFTEVALTEEEINEILKVVKGA
tara:strand:- start:363 stop:665 length:303 start_codon:yes stop_codon:yes gene_type:complete